MVVTTARVPDYVWFLEGGRYVTNIIAERTYQ